MTVTVVLLGRWGEQGKQEGWGACQLRRQGAGEEATEPTAE